MKTTSIFDLIPLIFSIAHLHSHFGVPWKSRFAESPFIAPNLFLRQNRNKRFIRMDSFQKPQPPNTKIAFSYICCANPWRAGMFFFDLGLLNTKLNNGLCVMFPLSRRLCFCIDSFYISHCTPSQRCNFHT